MKKYPRLKINILLILIHCYSVTYKGILRIYKNPPKDNRKQQYDFIHAFVIYTPETVYNSCQNLNFFIFFLFNI